MSSAILTPEEHVLPTLEGDGSRRWLTPTVSAGGYWRRRRVVGYGLIALFVALPFVSINGKPAVLLDIVARRFVLFGATFLPTDTLLLALLMLCVFLGVFLATALFGRVWCGWGCPQTVYMEFVYRPIERFFDQTGGRGGKPSKKLAGWRRAARYATYLVVSFALANVFLAYFVGVERLATWMQTSPVANPSSFAVMAVMTGLMMFDFCFFREQLCLVACPYGRFQSVLLDRVSLIVGYDARRGDPRGKKSKKRAADLPVLGDCVDCRACVRTCPTGIDIRDGLQLECIHCTQCVDACDAIMTRLGRPTGLIRYASQAELDGETGRFLRPRTVLYPTALVLVASVLATLVVTQKSFDVTLLRNFGHPYIVADDGTVKNSVRVKIQNRADSAGSYGFAFTDAEGTPIDGLSIEDGSDGLTVPPVGLETTALLVAVEPRLFTRPWLDVRLTVEADDGDRRTIPYRLLGPMGAAARPVGHENSSPLSEEG